MTRRPPAFLPDVAALARQNRDYRRVIYTGPNLQLVLMAIPPGGRIGTEVHPRVEQAFFIVGGRGEARVAGHGSVVLGPGGVLVVPPWTRHDVMNIGRSWLKLYTIYAPPNHLPGTVHPTISDARADTADEAFGNRAGRKRR